MMKTELIRIYDPAEDAEGVLRAGDILAHGGLVAIPTETVYGLAANAYDEAAVKAVYAAKGRPSDNPMIVHIAELSALPELVTAIPENAKILAEAFWPGPLTMVLPRSSKIPLTTTGGLETVAIRMPSHPVARAVIRAAGVPLAAPSANRSGSPSPTTFRHCVDDLWGLVDAIVESDDCTVGVESTVLCFLPDGTPQVLRPGAVTPEEIQRRCGCVSVAEAVLHMLPQDAAAPSPGMKYKHYAPAATLTLLCGSREDYAARVNEYYETLQRAGEEDGFYAMCFDEDVSLLEAPTISYGVAYDYPSQAQNLFDVLRQLDQILTKPSKKSGVVVRVQTFGEFEVFVNNKPLVWERKKARELMAYLVDKRGASATTAEIALALWDDDSKIRSVQTIISSLRKTLRKAGVTDVLVKSRNRTAVDVSKICCDLYEFIDGNVAAVNAYRGEYMSNYSWAEFTNGHLYHQTFHRFEDS